MASGWRECRERKTEQRQVRVGGFVAASSQARSLVAWSRAEVVVAFNFNVAAPIQTLGYFTGKEDKKWHNLPDLPSCQDTIRLPISTNLQKQPHLPRILPILNAHPQALPPTQTRRPIPKKTTRTTRRAMELVGDASIRNAQGNALETVLAEWKRAVWT